MKQLVCHCVVFHDDTSYIHYDTFTPGEMVETNTDIAEFRFNQMFKLHTILHVQFTKTLYLYKLYSIVLILYGPSYQCARRLLKNWSFVEFSQYITG